MTGIAGIRSWTRVADVHDTLERMAHRLHHRGPDGTDVWIGDDVGLVRTRSASAGDRSPVQSPDGRWSVVLDGRIANQHELRGQLDHPFRTTCATEVVLAGLSLEGISFVERLEGHFALAAHDGRTDTTHLVRDRLGVRPLHYRHVPGGVVFGSEVKALLVVGPAPGVDPRSLDAYLTDRSVPSPDTLFEGVKKVRPAHRVSIAPTGHLQEVRYWAPPDLDPAETWTDDDAVESVGDGVREAVRAVVEPDAPVGVLLLDGVNSDLLVAHARQLGDEAPLHTFAAGLDATDPGLMWGRRLSSLLRTRHHELVVGPADVDDLWTRLSWHRESPISEPADVVAHLLAREAREHVGVALSGAGGDELFGGSPQHRHPRLAGPSPAVPAPLRSALALPLARRVGVRRLRRAAAFTAAERRVLLGTGPAPERRTAAAAGADPLDRMLRQDLRHWLPDDVLERADRMAGAASLELLVPLLDDRLTELAFRLPSSVKVRAGTTKWVLRQAARPLLPDPLIDRPDDVPPTVGRWFARGLHEVARERLTSRDSWVGQTLDRSFVAELLQRREHGAGEEDRLWTLVCLEMWHDAFFGSAPSLPRARTGSLDSSLDSAAATPAGSA